MPNKIIDKCPACGSNMQIKTLKCVNCGIEINGDFAIEKVSLDLTESDMDFVKTFFKNEGNYSKVQNELGISYLSLKARLKDINIKLGNEEEEIVMSIDEKKLSSVGKASQRIIEKFSECGGTSYCDMIKGAPLKIWMAGDGVMNSGFKGFVCEWEIFDAIVEKAKELGGKMYRGDSAAMNGEKIGSDKFSVDTIDAFISLKFYGSEIGETALRRSTYYAAILAWAGICKNYRSKGLGGYIELNPEWK